MTSNNKKFPDRGARTKIGVGKTRSQLNTGDWFKTGILLDVSACILYALLLAVSPQYETVIVGGWSEILSSIFLFSFVIIRVVLYLLFSPGRLSRNKMLVEISVAALVALIPLVASNAYEYILQVMLFYPIAWLINGALYWFAQRLPPLFSKKTFYVVSFTFIGISVVGLTILVVLGAVPVLDFYSGLGSMVALYALVLASGSILRALTGSKSRVARRIAQKRGEGAVQAPKRSLRPALLVAVVVFVSFFVHAVLRSYITADLSWAPVSYPVLAYSLTAAIVIIVGFILSTVPICKRNPLSCLIGNCLAFILLFCWSIFGARELYYGYHNVVLASIQHFWPHYLLFLSCSITLIVQIYRRRKPSPMKIPKWLTYKLLLAVAAVFVVVCYVALSHFCLFSV